jgi:hypothetical protein
VTISPHVSKSGCLVSEVVVRSSALSTPFFSPLLLSKNVWMRSWMRSRASLSYTFRIKGVEMNGTLVVQLFFASPPSSQRPCWYLLSGHVLPDFPPYDLLLLPHHYRDTRIIQCQHGRTGETRNTPGPGPLFIHSFDRPQLTLLVGHILLPWLGSLWEMEQQQWYDCCYLPLHLWQRQQLWPGISLLWYTHCTG